MALEPRRLRVDTAEGDGGGEGGTGGKGTSPERLDAPLKMLLIDSAAESLDGTRLFALDVGANAPQHLREMLRRTRNAYFPRIKLGTVMEIKSNLFDSKSPEAEQHAREIQAYFEERVMRLENVLNPHGPFGPYDVIVTLV